jgi:hypothetical protein
MVMHEEDPERLAELRNIDKLTMKRKLQKLDRIISRQVEFRTPLAPNGKPYVEDKSSDVRLSTERLYIMKTLRKNL